MKEMAELFSSGGSLMVPLVFMNFMIWWGLAQRWVKLKTLTSNVVSRHCDLQKLRLAREAKEHRQLILILVTAAPLVGLLGTVIGMIETFDSLAEMALFSQDGGIAGGIAQALITTQMGLVIAIPGLILGRLLNRREDKIVAGGLPS